MKILVAGIGNILRADDGFGPAVAIALAARAWPAGVEVRDFGIRGMDLAFALTAGIDAAILVDAVRRGGVPGTLYVLEPARDPADFALEGHAMDPVRVLALAAALGEPPAFVRVVGCDIDEPDADELVGELSAPIAGAVAGAVDLIDELVAHLVAEDACTN